MLGPTGSRRQPGVERGPVRIRLGVEVDLGTAQGRTFDLGAVRSILPTWPGAYRLRPDDTRGGSQTLDLQPAQGGFVEFTFDEDGLYPFVTHKFANVGKGALGLFAVGYRWAMRGVGTPGPKRCTRWPLRWISRSTLPRWPTHRSTRPSISLSDPRARPVKNEHTAWLIQ